MLEAKTRAPSIYLPAADQAPARLRPRQVSRRCASSEAPERKDRKRGHFRATVSNHAWTRGRFVTTRINDPEAGCEEEEWFDEGDA
ncbi:hypothetical protein DPEC_G00062290 [Dallia pectoralis]|uniref:Uncharacterized protein n=1 Tax=Dallia pectoralis TaxID=75939 RepID=A0ACC2H838_DALPE|nr:hypothetical protein DPEC_G00062290 [Dallia pectoralis]